MDRPPLHVKEASDYIGVPVNTLRYWKHRGEGPRAYKLGGRVVYDVADLDAYRELAKATTATGGKVPAPRSASK